MQVIRSREGERGQKYVLKLSADEVNRLEASVRTARGLRNG